MTRHDALAEQLEALADGPALDAADDIAEAFERAGDRISDALSRAALSGTFSFNSLAESITRDFARLAVDSLITQPLQGVVDGLGKAIGGGAGAAHAPNVTINLNAPIAGQDGRNGMSQAQLASRLAQAVTRGQGRG